MATAVGAATCPTTGATATGNSTVAAAAQTPTTAMAITDGTMMSAVPTNGMMATTATTTGTVHVIAEVAGTTTDATVETDADGTEVTAAADEAATAARELTPMLSATAVTNSASSTATVEVPRMTATENRNTSSTAGDTTAETTTATSQTLKRRARRTKKTAGPVTRRSAWIREQEKKRVRFVDEQEPTAAVTSTLDGDALVNDGRVVAATTVRTEGEQTTPGTATVATRSNEAVTVTIALQRHRQVVQRLPSATATPETGASKPGVTALEPDIRPWTRTAIDISESDEPGGTTTLMGATVADEQAATNSRTNRITNEGRQ
ncbi:hypothetical protein DVH05_004263 [Phytophthora capsici]|nr:hypothetical protein DVH05_004263 [Phytophthora capsici]